MPIPHFFTFPNLFFLFVCLFCVLFNVSSVLIYFPENLNWLYYKSFEFPETTGIPRLCQQGKFSLKIIWAQSMMVHHAPKEWKCWVDQEPKQIVSYSGITPLNAARDQLEVPAWLRHKAYDERGRSPFLVCKVFSSLLSVHPEIFQMVPARVATLLKLMSLTAP